jgi:periplasmic protein TonB
VSVAVHASVVVALLFIFSPSRDEQPVLVTRVELPKLVWMPDPGPAARGGGSPARRTPPPPIPAPAVAAPPPSPVAVEPPTIAPEPEPPAPVATAPESSAVADAGPPSSGVGTTPGSGVGGDPGPGGGGDRIFGIGNDVTAPIALRRPPPAYTAEAMRARLQGVVVLHCVVRPDGRCSDIRVTKSLDTVFGLDQQAIASAREWRFRPGERMGEPVSVLVTLEIGFTIR